VRHVLLNLRSGTAMLYKKVANFSNLTVFLGAILLAVFSFVLLVISGDFYSWNPSAAMKSAIVALFLGTVCFIIILSRWKKLGLLFRTLAIVLFLLESFILFECIKGLWLHCQF